MRPQMAMLRRNETGQSSLWPVSNQHRNIRPASVLAAYHLFQPGSQGIRYSPSIERS